MTQVPPPPSTPYPVVPVCYRHTNRETYVRCNRCERPICPECMTEASVGHQCPECVAEGRRTQRAGRTVFGGTMAGIRGSVTTTLVMVNVLAAVLVTASAGREGLVGGGLGSLLGGSTSPLLRDGAIVGQARFRSTQTGAEYLGPYGIADGEFYRLFTAMFLHFGILHLLMNMWALWVLGRTLEGVLGPIRFVALYLVAGLGGSVAVYVFSPESTTVGASGAIFGLFAALFVVLKRLKRDTSSVLPILVLNLAISFLPGISLAGHLGGLVTGAVIAIALAYTPQKSRNLVVAATVAALLVVMAIAVVVQTAALQGYMPISG